MNKRLIGGALVTACSLAALLSYADRSLSDPSVASNLQDQERALLSHVAAIMGKDDMMLAQVDLSELPGFEDSAESQLPPIDDGSLEPAPELPRNPSMLPAREEEAPALLPEEEEESADAEEENEEPIVLEQAPFLSEQALEQEPTLPLDAPTAGDVPTVEAPAVEAEAEAEEFIGEEETGEPVAEKAGEPEASEQTLEEGDLGSLSEVQWPDPELIDVAQEAQALEAVDDPDIDPDVCATAREVAQTLPVPEADLLDVVAQGHLLEEVEQSQEDYMWARNHVRNLVTLFDNITGYPLYGVEGELDTIAFSIPSEIQPPGELLVTGYIGNEHLAEKHPGWCMTLIGFIDENNQRSYWVHEGAEPNSDGRLAEVADLLGSAQIMPEVVEREILEDGEEMHLYSICLGGSWGGVSPLQSTSLFQVLSGEDLGEGTILLRKGN